MNWRLAEGAPILTAADMRAVEEAAFAAGVSQMALMERAGLSVARAARRLSGEAPIVILAGPGNNGGDAYAAARHLSDWGHDVTVAAMAMPGTVPAAAMAARWTGRTVPLADADQPRLPFILVDGLLGTGASRPLRDARADLFLAARWRVAIDLPSGVDADSGALRGAPAPMNATVALGALKPAHVLAPDRCGHVVLDDLGLTLAARWRTVARPASLRPAADQHKYRALVTIVAGAMPGAARLAARGAVGAGAGYVVLVGDRSATGPLDSIVHRARDDEGEERGVLLVGPGLGRDDAARVTLDAAIASERSLVLDGDALTLLGDRATERLRGRGPTVLTPHEGEFQRMFGEGAGSKIARTLSAAQATGAKIVHKGASTVIASPDGEVRVSTAGSSWLATAGTGDVLAGAVAARIAQGGQVEDAVWLHARASHLAGAAFSADRLADVLPWAVAECR